MNFGDTIQPMTPCIYVTNHVPTRLLSSAPAENNTPRLTDGFRCQLNHFFPSSLVTHPLLFPTVAFTNFLRAPGPFSIPPNFSGWSYSKEARRGHCKGMVWPPCHEAFTCVPSFPTLSCNKARYIPPPGLWILCLLRGPVLANYPSSFYLQPSSPWVSSYQHLNKPKFFP